MFNAELQAKGAWVFAGGLHPADTATVVRAKDGEVLTTDGPFAETKEQLGGFWVIEAADLDAALALAGQGAARPARPRSRSARSRTSPRAESRVPTVDASAVERDLPAGVRPCRRHPGPPLRRHRPRRGGGPGGVRRRRCSAGRRPACRRTRAAGSSPPPATGPSTGSAASRPATTATPRPRCSTTATSHPRRWDPCPTTACA